MLHFPHMLPFSSFWATSDPHAMSMLAAHHVQFQVSQNQIQNLKESTAAGSTAPYSQAAAI
jgi:hypothetical protein